MDLNYFSLAEAAELIAKREISSEDLIQAHLDRISILESSIKLLYHPDPRSGS